MVRKAPCSIPQLRQHTRTHTHTPQSTRADPMPPIQQFQRQAIVTRSSRRQTNQSNSKKTAHLNCDATRPRDGMSMTTWAFHLPGSRFSARIFPLFLRRPHFHDLPFRP
ncbi:hypothetical protein VTH06DRAFT_4616 [Thermothelomyces fergusii]